MDMRIGDRGDAAAAAGPADSAERRDPDGGIIAELEGELVVKRVPEVVQQGFLPGAVFGIIQAQHRMQVPNGPDIAQDALGIDVFIDIQRATVAFLMPDIGFVVPFFAFQQAGQVRFFPGQAAVTGRRGQAPGAGEGIVLQAGAGLFGKDIGIFPVFRLL